MDDAVVVAVGRSPVGRASKGSLVDRRPDDLGATVVTSVLSQVPELDPATIDDVICGCAQPAGEHGFNLGRAISLIAGLDAPGVTVNRYCASSLQALRMAAHAVEAGEGDAFVVVGVECVSRYGGVYPADLPEYRNERFGSGDSEQLPDYYISMGETAENVADREGVTREEMDLYAVRSHRLAVAAQESGFFEREIIPVEAGGTLVAKDDGPRPTTSVEALGELKPVFRENGSVTAGNACPLNDGAAAAIVMSMSKTLELGVRPLARIVATSVSALEPEYMGLGPVVATTHALAKAGMNIDDIDLVEMNEAFAAQVLPSARGLGLDPFGDRLNVHGGAIALGHPFGMTGVRMLCTLLNGLKSADLEIGLETLCVGGGQGMALIVERLN